MPDVTDEDAKAYARTVGALMAAGRLAEVCEAMIEAGKADKDGKVARAVVELRKYRPKGKSNG